jgi:hypothetical protein|tara:strand:+ start:3014 stop:3214 length:201 start_codon:yes stop_codon:yes gene_type:complete
MTKPFESTFIFSQSWTYNEEISDWEAPVPRPALTDDDKVNRKMYRWTGAEWELTVVPDNIPYPHSV